MITATKRKSISLIDKLKIITEIEEGATQADVARQSSLPKQTVQNIWSKREKIKEDAKNVNVGYKKVRKCDYPTLDNSLIQWFNLQRARNVPISGPILKGKAFEVATELGMVNFKASEGWLESWKKRHGVIFKTAAGEGASVDVTGVEDWIKTVWKSVSAGYNPCDIYNADETGLFYRLIPHKTLEFKGKECHGGKLSKERITVLLCANADGSDKLKPLVIGRSKRPQCFKNIRDYSALPVHYESNTKAWMTSSIFEKWMKLVNNQMKSAKRKILMVLDNCSAHVAANLRLDHVKILFLPPNATSMVQPLDRGIINSFKVKYRTAVVKKIILKLEAGEVPKITVLDAIYELDTSWREVTSECIVNCFRSSKLMDVATEPAVDVLQQIDLPSFPELNLPDFDFSDFVHADDNLVLFEENVFPDVRTVSSPEPEENNASSEEEEEEQRQCISNRDALKCVEDLKFFFTCSNSNELFLKELGQMERDIINKSMASLKQVTITNYFNKS